MGEKGEGFRGTIIKDIWTITRGCVETGEAGGEGWSGRKGWREKAENYLNNNNNFKRIKIQPTWNRKKNVTFSLP